jgi:tRNA 2-thiocytidine biosynthesis protein TtcA
LLLNLVFSGQLKSMPPKLISDDKRSVVIRPLVFASQDDIQLYAQHKNLPVLPPPRCGAPEQGQRAVVERLLDDLEALHPGAQANMMAALANVRPSHLFDVALWERLGLDVATELAPRSPERDR